MAAPTRKTGSGKATTARGGKKRRSAAHSNAPLLAIGGLLVFMIIAAVFAISQQNGGGGTPASSIEGVRVFPNLDRGHTTDTVLYEQNPPVGGRHNPSWQNCGVYNAPVPNETAVHSLEHGAIWITYQPNLPAAELEKLQRLTRQSAYRLLSPYPDLPSPIVASAWGYQLGLDSADDPRLGQFIQRYEQNPLGPEPGAACTGGTGQPS